MKLFVLLSVFLYVCYAESALVSINLYGEENQSLLENLLSEDCSDRFCDRKCQRAGYSDGSCNAGKCSCGEKVDVSEKSPPNKDTHRSCDSLTCSRMCRRMHYTGGYCVGTNICKCY